MYIIKKNISIQFNNIIFVFATWLMIDKLASLLLSTLYDADISRNVHRSATSRAYVCVFFCFTLYLTFLADKRHYLPEKTVKKYMLQLCKSVDHCHRYVQVEMAASKVTA